jgi:pimeloyl-ACP methyl ester carboxylesterase
VTSPAHHTVDANGLAHHVLEWAPSVARASGAVAVLVHGYMDAAGTWDLVAPSLASAGLRVLAPDMRGYGEGPRVARGAYYHFPDYVADLADIIDAVVPATPAAPLFLVGHSMGGTISTLYAGSFPERVARLALLEGLGPPDHPPEASPDRMRQWILDVRGVRARGNGEKSVGTLDDAFRRLAVNHSGVSTEVLRTRVPHLVRDLGDGRVAWRFDPLHRTASPTPFYARTLVAFAKKVTCPTLFVGGGPTGFHPPDEEERLAAFGSLRRVDIADAGHMIHWTVPAELSRVLLEHWSGGIT